MGNSGANGIVTGRRTISTDGGRVRQAAGWNVAGRRRKKIMLDREGGAGVRAVKSSEWWERGSEGGAGDPL